MAVMIRKLCFRTLIFIFWVSLRFMKQGSIELVFSQRHSLISCDSTSTDAPLHRCDVNESQNHCTTFALLYANSYYSSLSNLSLYLGLNQTGIAEASGLPIGMEVLQKNQPFLIPIDCNCNGGFFQAKVIKTAIRGETFDGVAASLEGLTTCKAIEEKNPGLSPWGLDDKAQVLVPLICACPTAFLLSRGTKLLVSYPIYEGDTISNLASVFNSTVDAIVSANNRSGPPIMESLMTVPSLLIPLVKIPDLGPLLKAHGPDSAFNNTSVPLMDATKKRSRRLKASMPRIYITLAGVAVGLAVAVTAAVLVIQARRKPNLCSKGDVELQQLNIRHALELKDELEEPHLPLNDQKPDYMPHKVNLDTFTIDELRRATEDFNLSNLIEGSMFHGRLNGKNLAIKQTKAETISKIEYELFDGTHLHPNILQLLGTCLGDACDSYLVFEYAKNGSLKDWLHGGLAMKSQFIASCYCFLTWNQRLRICLQVALGLHYMHHTMNPSYVHRNIKSRNVLLDEEFNAKIANFGMAKCCDNSIENPHLLSTRPTAWSRGYMAPEFVEHGRDSPSIDIYAYGVVLLEVMSGRTPINRDSKKGESIFLTEQIRSILHSDKEEELRDWMDSAIGDAYSFSQAMSLAKIARACVEEDPSYRPSAEEIVEKLARLVEDLPEGEQIPSGGSCSKTQAKV